MMRANRRSSLNSFDFEEAFSRAMEQEKTKAIAEIKRLLEAHALTIDDIQDLLEEES